MTPIMHRETENWLEIKPQTMELLETKLIDSLRNFRKPSNTQPRPQDWKSADSEAPHTPTATQREANVMWPECVHRKDEA